MLLASVVAAGLLAVGFLGTAPVALAASAEKSAAKPGKSARSYVLKNKRRSRPPRVHLPVGPSYIYYDYPYYYSRGYYPRHIVGYVYYPYYGHYYRDNYRDPGLSRRKKARNK
jgi:hypothetical protein